MKNIKIALILLVLISISSCDEFLSETPDNRTQLDSDDKISEILVNAYPTFTYMDVAETMSDNVFDSGKQFGAAPLKNLQNYNWELQNEFSIDTQAGYWDACYEAIAHANQALQAIEQQGYPSSLNPQRGEALLARAYAHFMLVSFWSNRYNPETADTDLGIPYVTEPEGELIKSYTRNTIQEVFDFIEKDMEEGLKYVGNTYASPKFHFTQEAGKALACRFYTITGNWDKVLDLSSDLGSKPAKIRSFGSYQTLDFDTQRIRYASETEQTNLLVVSASSAYWRAAFDNRFYLSGGRNGEILGPSTNIYNKQWLYAIYSYNGSITSFVPKFYEYFKVTNPAAGIGLSFLATVLLSNDEMYLNRIEALVMKNRFAEANTELGYFLGTRTQGYNPATDFLTEAKIEAKYPVIADEFTPFYSLSPLQKSYIKAITEARRRDFIHEGIRWFDVKRFNIVVVHENDGGSSNTLVKDDKRRAWQIPLHVSNTGLEKNPR